MPAIVRVKRRVDEEPLSAFVLNGKKRRLDDGSAAAVEAEESVLCAVGVAKDDISTILKFAGTIVEQDDDATTQFARLTKEKAKELVQQKARRPTTATEKSRENVRQATHENRFKIVNCMRTALQSTDEAAAGDSTEFTIVDIEKQAQTKVAHMERDVLNNLANAVNLNTSDAAAAPSELTQPSDSDTGYVYDLYLPENEQQAEYVDMMDDNYLSVRPFDDLFYEDRFNDIADDEYDSEDSNQENHFGNDYPDEDADVAHSDDEESEDERETRLAMEKFVFGDDEEDEEAAGYAESSDDEDCNQYQDPYVHTVDVDEDDDDELFAYGVDLCDVQRYGVAYARYKKRVLKKLNGEDTDNTDEDLSSVGSADVYHSASENE